MSEEYFIDNKKDNTAVYWEKEGIIRTQYFDKGVLISEDVINQANLISNISLKKYEYLYYYYTGEEHERLFVLIKFIDESISSDKYKKKMVSKLLSNIEDRLISIADKSAYSNEFIANTVEISNLKFYTEAHAYTGGSTVTVGSYKGYSTYTITLLDNRNKVLDQSPYDSKTNTSFYYGSGDKGWALDKGANRAECEHFMYKYFPVKSEIIEITKQKGNRALQVKISAGSEIGVKRKFNFNVYSGDLSKSSIVGKLEVTEVYPTYSLCKVTSGEESVLSRFNSEIKLKLISNL
jgi:hypothetical protein